MSYSNSTSDPSGGSGGNPGPPTVSARAAPAQARPMTETTLRRPPRPGSGRSHSAGSANSARRRAAEHQARRDDDDERAERGRARRRRRDDAERKERRKERRRRAEEQKRSTSPSSMGSSRTRTPSRPRMIEDDHGKTPCKTPRGCPATSATGAGGGRGGQHSLAGFLWHPSTPISVPERSCISFVRERC